MADDPNRDLLPVRDGSYIESYRSIMAMTADPRDRHMISKIDRDDLEDKYLRLLEECQELRKLSNTQEDKIKRLGTKLMRVSATPKSCTPASVDANSNENRIDMLKMENIKLKDKIVVLRNQILSHRVLRQSPSQTRRLTICTSSRPTTCRSESGRIKSLTCQNFVNDRDDDVISGTYVNKIGELEEQRKQMIVRIDDLENRLASSQAGFQKDKIAENVEYIRVRREMKLCHEKLMEAEAMKKVLSAQVQEMKSYLDETMKDNGQLTATLDAERKRLSEIDERVSKSQDNQLREKDEQIHDLMNEMKILQQHNSELLDLSSKYSLIEAENSELKKKLSESLTDNHNLKSAFSNEQTNIKALQAANEKLLEKLQSTQSNIDNLTVQLKSVQNHHQTANMTVLEDVVKEKVVKKFDKQTNTTLLLPTNNSIDMTHLNDTVISQNSPRTERNGAREFRDQSSSPIKLSYRSQTPPEVETIANKIEKAQVTSGNKIFDNGRNKLSREEVLKLLDEAQINTPLNTKRAIAVRHSGDLSSNKCTDANYRQSSRSVRSSPSSSPPRGSMNQGKIRGQDHHEIIKHISRILEDYFRAHINDVLQNSTQPYKQSSLPRPSNSIQDNRLSTGNKSVPPTSSQAPQDLYDQNNNNYYYNKLSNKSHDEITALGDELIPTSMRTMYHELEESDQCICNGCEKCNEYCRCSINDRKCDARISSHSSDAAIDDKNTLPTKTETENITSCYQLCRPMSKTKQLETGLCCEPDKTIKDSRNSRIAMEKPLPQHQADSSSENSLECQRPCPVVRKEQTEYVPDIDGKNKYNDTIDALNSYSPSLETDRGLVEIHISSLLFSPIVEGSLFGKDKTIINRSLLISCELYGQKSISTSMVKYPDTNFNSSCIFEVANVDEFRKNISDKDLSLQLHIVFHKDLSYIIARGKINLENIFINSQTKHHYVVNMESLVPCFRRQKFGQLSLWVRHNLHLTDKRLPKEKKLSIESDDNKPIIQVVKNELRNDSEVRGDEPPTPTVEMMHGKVSEHAKDGTIPSNEPHPTMTPDKSFKNSETSRNERTSNIPRKNAKMQFTDSVKNPWQPWRQKNHVNGTYNETGKCSQSAPLQNGEDSTRHRAMLNHDTDGGGDCIVIMIERLKLVQHCSLFCNPNIHRLYVEFFFLGGYGVEYETVSVPIPKSHTEYMYFNYIRKFCLDERNHPNERNYLRRVLIDEENPDVQLNIVSEPLVDAMETEECVDVGHTHFNLKEHILNGGSPDIFLSVRNPENTESLGVLKISIFGTNALRQSLLKSPTTEES